ncbi:Hypothetical protein I595_1212 [Croceitalea dokdonensis DOKDO 023]|uniref:Uncharacterized protein n=2 Tax=Croceitalea TaxID=574891 RepID=A0A0P7AVW7_9FLAO|nr:Hypothetical protein I595_1212 [Croceitalea dokdonensis DOKDO 023]
MIGQIIKSFILFIILMSNIQMKAQTLSKQVNLQELGLSFDIPEGWQGQLDGDYIVLGHQTIPGLLILSSNTTKSITELKAFAEQGITEGNVQLSADSHFVEKNNNRVEGYYTGIFNGQQVKAYAIGLINGRGKGMNILIVTKTTAFTATHKKEADKLSNSVKFYKAEDSNVTTFWKQKLMGKQLYFGLTRGDGSEKRTIDLCPDGSFAYYGNSHIAFDESYGFGSAGSNENDSGTYNIYSVGDISVLELAFTDGTIVEYDLSTNEEGNTFLDNSRYYVQNSDYCH